ncbi:MAG TPA: hypothetical protein VIL81_08710, partial [Candidatus Limnocylindrales bacterium]
PGTRRWEALRAIRGRYARGFVGAGPGEPLPVLWVAYVLGSRKGFNSRGRPAALGGILVVTSQPT